MKRVLCLVWAAATVVLFAGAAGAQELVYVFKNGAADSGGGYTVTRNDIALVKNVDGAAAINAIRANAMRGTVTIQFGETVEKPLNLGGPLTFDQLGEDDENRQLNFSKIKLTGSVKGNENSIGYLLNFRGNTSDTTEVEIDADIVGGIYVNGTYKITIKGGSVELPNFYSRMWFTLAKVTITGGTITKAQGNGGNVSAVISDISELTISGGKIESKQGAVLQIGGDSKVAISGTAELVTDTALFPVVDAYGNASVAITGGKVSNTKPGGVAVKMGAAVGSLLLGGAPEITGAISTKYVGQITADASFKPGANKYELLLSGGILDNGAVVVKGGGAFLSSFVYDHPPYTLAAAGGNIVVALPANFTAPKYVITGDVESGFTAAKAGQPMKSGAMSVVLDSIRADAKALPCSVQFGGGAQFLEVGGSRVIFVGGTGDGWGKVTLLGKLSGIASMGQYGAMSVLELTDIAVDNSADIKDNGQYRYSVRLSDNVSFTHKSGEIADGIYIRDNGTLTVAGGKVGYIYNVGVGSTVTVSGGTVGDSAYVGNAITNASSDGEVYITGGTVASADTAIDGGTIINRGTLMISGGKVSNADKIGYAIAVNNGYAAAGDTTASVVISDSAQVFSSGKRTNSAQLTGVVTNRRGVVEISGGKVFNAAADTACPVVYNAAKLKVSGSADIASKAAVNRFAAVYSISYVTYGQDTVVVEVTGGKISAAAGFALLSRGYRTVISGTAEVTSPSANGAVYVDYNTDLYLLGGTVSTTAPDSVVGSRALNIWPGGRAGVAGRLTMGGSPTINGRIGHTDIGDQMGDALGPITIRTTGASAFAPGAKKYTVVIGGEEGRVILKNGAGFVSSFALDTAGNAGFKLAASGDDVVATAKRTREVKFNIMGAKGTAPTAIVVVDGGTLGQSAKPSTAPYVIVKSDGKSYKNDGEWHIGGAQSADGEWSYSGNVFKFGVGNDGTDVTNDMTLLLKWTDSVAISVLQPGREIPAAPTVEAVSVAPITITAGELTAGPNPSAKRSGKINFFWNGAPLKNGTLLIYDASGNVVGKAAISDKSGATGKRAVASWNLTDAKGRPAADGVYAAKGVINAKSGKAEKVSILLGVR